MLYADNIALVSEPTLACKIVLIEYCDKWRLAVNIKKTETMVLEKWQSPINQTSFTYKNNALDMCKSYSYLGTIIFHNGQFKSNINELCKKASRAMCTLLGNANKCYAGNIRI